MNLCIARLRLYLADPSTASRAVHAILRLGVWACFVGHGMFGIRQKAEWLVFFEPFNFSETLALTTMPLIGLVDISLGYLALLRPTRVLFMYTAFWGVFTGILRPLVGLSVFETLERAGNYGPSLALLLGTGGAALMAQPGVYNLADAKHYDRMKRLLAVTTFLLLLGHGALALDAKPLLVRHWQSAGLGVVAAHGEAFTRIVGGCEIAAAFLVLLWPTRLLCLFIAGWKLFTEMLFIPAGDPVWEVLERGGSYAAPLALFVVLSYGVALASSSKVKMAQVGGPWPIGAAAGGALAERLRARIGLLLSRGDLRRDHARNL